MEYCSKFEYSYTLIIFVLLNMCCSHASKNVVPYVATDKAPNQNGDVRQQNTPNVQNSINRNRVNGGLLADRTVDPFDLPLIPKNSPLRSRAVSVAIASFQSDSMIPDEKKNLDNYNVELRQNREYFFVYFSAHPSQQDESERSKGGETSLGKSVMFVIAKQNFHMKRRYFFK